MIEKLLAKTANIFKAKTWVVIAVAAVTLALGAGLPRLKIDNSARGMLPLNNLDVETADYYNSEAVFGNPDFLFLGIEAKDVLTPEVLSWLRAFEADLQTTAAGMPKLNLQAKLGTTAAEADQLLAGLGAFDPNATDYKTAVAAWLRNPDSLKTAGLTPDRAAAVAAEALRLEPAVLADLVRNPVADTQSLLNSDYVTSEDGTLVTQKLLDTEDLTPEALAALKTRLASWDLYKGTLVSADQSMTGLMIKVRVSKEAATSAFIVELQKLLKQHENPAITTSLAGEYVINHFQGRYMQEDLAFILPLTIALMVALMAFFFRSWSAVFYTLLVILVAVVTGTGFMAWMGVPMTIISTTMPIILTAIACAYGIHQVSHYLADADTDKLAIFTRNMENVGLALLLSGLATMIGFGALVADNFVPIQNFGLYTAIGNLFALGAALYFLPAVILLAGPTKKVRLTEGRSGLISRLLKGLVVANRRWSGRILIVSTVILAVFAWGSTLVVSELNPVNFFRSDDGVRVATDRINAKMAGTRTLTLILDSDLRPIGQRPTALETPVDVVTPEILAKIDALGTDLQARWPDKVGKVLSLADLLKRMNLVMHDGDPSYNTIPDSKELIAQYMALFSGDMSPYVTFAGDKLKVTVTLRDVTTRQTEDIRHAILDAFPADWQRAHSLHAEVTGTAHLYTVANELLVEGTTHAILICVLMVFVLLLLVLRNLWMTLVALLPIGLTLAINFGVLGLFGIPLDAGTALVASVAIGIGVDFSIHFITWYRHERLRHPDVETALEEAILHKGRAILYNMFVIIGGFAVLALSRFVPLIEFGALVSLCMITTAVGSLVLVPAALRWLHRRGFKFVSLKK